MENDANMTSSQEATQPKMLASLRVWPALILLGLMVILRYLPALIEDGPAMIWMSSGFGPLLCSLVVGLWWVFFSRAKILERLIGSLGVIVALIAVIAGVDPTMRGPAIMMLTIPMGAIGFVIGATLLAKMPSTKRTYFALLLALVGFSFSLLLRADGMWGNFDLSLFWRWEPTAEQQLLADEANREKVDVQTLAPGSVDAGLAAPEWPGFRGPNRDGVQRGMAWSDDWPSNPPEELWRISVGPGWSSFVVAGDLCYTQEQRGDAETVTCYELKSGAEVWTQKIQARFEDPLGGPGPRATPTLFDGAIYAMGGTGQLLKLDPKTGEILWQVDVLSLSEKPQPPMWGFSGSPLGVGNLVIVHSAGDEDNGLLALNVDDGDVVWSVDAGAMSYASPQLMTVLGNTYLAMLTDTGIDLRDPETGEAKLKYSWQTEGYRAVQPQVIGTDSVLVPSGLGYGTRLIKISGDADALQAEEVWTSRDLKPDFNDYVVYQDHIYGFDAKFFCCIDLKTGKRKWKGGRYGKGQVLLLEDPGLLVVATETGPIRLLRASPEKLDELSELEALTAKTWNHPVVVGDRLLVRNSEEAVCYRLPVDEQLSTEDSEIDAEPQSTPSEESTSSNAVEDEN